MPARISPEKESQIIVLYLRGLSQTEIARNLRLSQSTISKAVSVIKRDASQNSPEEACSRRGALDIFEELRSLSADLRRAGVTLDQANRGYKLIDELGKIGGDLDMLQGLLAVYKRITPKEFPVEDFVQATVQTVRLEQECGKD